MASNWKSKFIPSSPSVSATPKKAQQCRLCKGSKRLHITDGVVIPLVDALELANRKSTERPAWADLPDRFLRESIECGDCNGTGSV